jgi:hypothetical protein
MQPPMETASCAILEGQQRFSSPGKLSKLFMMSGLLFQVNPTIGISHNLTRTHETPFAPGTRAA